MSAFNRQVLPQISSEQVIENHISVQSATRISGYNVQYLRRLLRVGKLDGVKVGQVWLVDLASLNAYLNHTLNSNDLRCGPKDALTPPF